MALIKCPECGKEISDKAVSCPNCGNPINTPEPQIEEYLCCPYCGSKELHAEKSGFSGGKALAGVIATGGIGLLAGTIGSRDIKITCLKCGKNFKAGEAKVVKIVPDVLISDNEKEIIEKIKALGSIGATKWYKDTNNVDLSTAKNRIDSIKEKYSVERENVSKSGDGCMATLLLMIASTIAFTLLF